MDAGWLKVPPEPLPLRRKKPDWVAHHRNLYLRATESLNKVDAIIAAGQAGYWTFEGKATLACDLGRIAVFLGYGSEVARGHFAVAADAAAATIRASTPSERAGAHIFDRALLLNSAFASKRAPIVELAGCPQEVYDSPDLVVPASTWLMITATKRFWLDDFVGSATAIRNALSKQKRREPRAFGTALRGLMDRDAAGFPSLLAEVVQAWRVRTRGKPNSPESLVCTSGLALARMAMSIGLPCPAEARFLPTSLLDPLSD